MTQRELLLGFGEIDEDLIRAAEDAPAAARRRRGIGYSIAAACLAMAVTAAAAWSGVLPSGGGTALSSASSASGGSATALGKVVTCYQGSGGTSSYTSPAPGQCFCFTEVNEARETYAGQGVVYLLAFDLFSAEGQLTQEEAQAEYQRLADLGYALYQVSCWTYAGAGERVYYTAVAGLFSEEQLENFPADPAYGYAFRFLTNGDGSPADFSFADAVPYSASVP